MANTSIPTPTQSFLSIIPPAKSERIKCMEFLEHKIIIINKKVKYKQKFLSYCLFYFQQLVHKIKSKNKKK